MFASDATPAHSWKTQQSRYITLKVIAPPSVCAAGRLRGCLHLRGWPAGPSASTRTWGLGEDPAAHCSPPSPCGFASPLAPAMPSLAPPCAAGLAWDHPPIGSPSATTLCSATVHCAVALGDVLPSLGLAVGASCGPTLRGE